MQKFGKDICVIGGCGHVGLPLAIAFADKGLKVHIYDINENSVKMIKEGNLPFMEQGCEPILQRTVNKTLTLSTEISSISEAKFVIIVVGTPVDEHLNPNFDTMTSFFNKIKPYLRDGQVLILRSTVYPGTTEKLHRIVKRDYKQIEVCFCPERILEGKAMEELYSLPQIVSGYDESAVEEVAKLFSNLTVDIVYTKPLEAELCKLFTNSWRYIQFATANQFYMMAEEFGGDFYKIYHAMTYKYPRANTFPRPGFAAGPCLFKDTMQLSAFSNNKFYLGHSAMLLNEGLPNFLSEHLKKQFDLKNMTVGILGMAFKAESDDIRESLSYKLKKIFEFEASVVLCADHFIPENEKLVSEEEVIEQSDIIIIGAPHKKYKELDYKNKKVIDVWNYIDKKARNAQ